MIIAKRGDDRLEYLGTDDDGRQLAVIVSPDGSESKPMNLQSILARGYWEEIEGDVVAGAGRIEMAARRKHSRWIPYKGPRGGEGWLDVVSHDVRYQVKKPGDEEAAVSDMLEKSYNPKETEEEKHARNAASQYMADRDWEDRQHRSYEEIEEIAFLRHHKTGSIKEDAYSDKENNGFGDLDFKKNVPHGKVILKDGSSVELFSSGEKLQYTATDSDGNIRRGSDGLILSMTDAEIEADGLPTHDTTIVAFVGDEAVGYASDEFGATGVYVVKAWQKKGLGTSLLKKFNEVAKRSPSKVMGQMTPAGESLAIAFYREIKDSADIPARVKVARWAKQRFGNKRLPDGSYVAANFVEWFGNSKMVDESGAPVVMYHGTPKAGFDEFQVGRSSDGVNRRNVISVSPSPDFASMYAGRFNGGEYAAGGGVYPLYVRAENPADFRNPMHVELRMQWERDNFEDFLRNKANRDAWKVETEEKLKARVIEESEKRRDFIESGYWTMWESPDFLKENGFDSAFVKESRQSDHSDIVNLVVLDGDQIKSSIGNSGGFSGRNIKMSAWVKYRGPRDGRGWKNTSTGEVRYQDKIPDDESHAVSERDVAEYLFGGRSDEVKVLAADIFPEIEKRRAVSLIGVDVKSSDDLVKVAQAYRDPRFETFRVVFVKGGKVVGQNAYSSRLPSVVAFPPRMVEDVQRDINEIGADEYYLLHNHPSGNPSPSDDDWGATNYLVKQLKNARFAGHVIVNHTKASVLEPLSDSRLGMSDVPLKLREVSVDNEDLYSNPEVSNELIGKELTSSTALADFAMKNRPEDGRAIAVLTNARGSIRAVFDVDLNSFRREDYVLYGALRRISRKLGTGGKRFLVIPQDDGKVFSERPESVLLSRKLRSSGLFTDVIVSGQRQTHQESDEYFASKDRIALDDGKLVYSERVEMSWVPYRGVNKPRKGERVGWKNTGTGEIRYVDEQPSDEDRADGRAVESSRSIEELKEDKSVFWHGTPSGDLRGAENGLHVGTFEAASQALNARIGIPASGMWDGSRVYGETLLAGKKTLKKLDPRGYNVTGFNANAPEHDYYAKDMADRQAKYGDGTSVDFKSKPEIFPVKIVGSMTGPPTSPRTDSQANTLIRRQKKLGNSKNGMYYKNEGEDAGSVSAAVPDVSFIQRVDVKKEPAKSVDSDLKTWLGKSKVVNPDGSPMLVYHGTNADFKEFDISKSKASDIRGAYFTSKQEFAKIYGAKKIVKAYLKIENPATFADAERLAKTGIKTKDLHKALMKEGFDGLISSEEGRTPIFIAFDKSQIRMHKGEGGDGSSDSVNSHSMPRNAKMSSWVRYKGPRDGRGWKDTATGEIRYQEDQPGADVEATAERSGVEVWAEKKFGDKKKAANFAKWFNGSKLVDENGDPVVMYHGTNSDFDAFSKNHYGRTDDGYLGHGFYFATDGEWASDYGGNVIDAALLIKKPLVVPWTGVFGHDSLFDVRDALAAIPGLPEELKTNRSVPDGYKVESRELGDGDWGYMPGQNNIRYYVAPLEALYGTDKEIYGDEKSSQLDAIVSFNDRISDVSYDEADTASLFKRVGRKKIKSALVSAGYDGIITIDPDTQKLGEVVVFEPSQIKSLSKNSGEFSAASESYKMSAWVRYKGPRDGTGWRSTSTGEIRYQEEQPGVEEPASKILDWAERTFGDKQKAANFVRWFGNSKAVNEDGEPVLVHHGGLGASKIEEFDVAFGSQTTGNNEHGAFHFVDSLVVAEDYGRQSFIRRYQDDPISLIGDGVLPEDTEIDETIGAEYGRVAELAEDRIETQSVYLKMENPVVIDMGGERVDVQRIEEISKAISEGVVPEFINETVVEPGYSESDIQDHKEEIERFIQENYDDPENIEPWEREEAVRFVMEENDIFPEYKLFDGIIIRNMIDDISDASHVIADQYIVFDSRQIKSAKNAGTFGGSGLIHMSSWVKYRGPLDGDGWRNTATGEIRYVDEKPGDEEPSGVVEKPWNAATYQLLSEPRPDLPTEKKHVSKVNIASFLRERHDRRIDTNGDYDEIAEADRNWIIESLTEDVLNGYKTNASGANWYAEDLRGGIEVLSEIDPDLKNKRDQFVLRVCLALLSSGQDPDSNMRDAMALYQYWKKSGTIVTDESFGNQTSDMRNAAELFQKIVEKVGSYEEAEELFLSKMTVRELEQAGVELLPELSVRRMNKSGTKEITPISPFGVMGELKDSEVPVFSVFGPKIGSFYANLSGDYSTLTMDRWFMRSWSRVSGEISSASKDIFMKQSEGLIPLIKKATKEELEGFDRDELLGELNKAKSSGEVSPESAIAKWSIARKRTYMQPNDSGRRYTVKTPINVKANSFAKLFSNLATDAPSNGSQRQAIRKVMEGVLDRVKKAGFKNANIAEIQAVLWYHEKKLYKHLGGRVKSIDSFKGAAERLKSGEMKQRVIEWNAEKPKSKTKKVKAKALSKMSSTSGSQRLIWTGLQNHSSRFIAGRSEVMSWVKYAGPRDGRGWRNISTGEIRYQEDKPGDASSQVRPMLTREEAVREGFLVHGMGSASFEELKKSKGFESGGFVVGKPVAMYGPKFIAIRRSDMPLLEFHSNNWQYTGNERGKHGVPIRSDSDVAYWGGQRYAIPLKHIYEADVDGNILGPLVESSPDDLPSWLTPEEVASLSALIPPEPGMTSAPPMFVRLFHYTDAPADAIRKNGILMSRAKGESYQEPNAVWASAEMPHDQKVFAEFFVPVDDPRFSFAKPHLRDRKATQDDADAFNASKSDVAFNGDIRPEEIVGVYEPWHKSYRHVLEDDPDGEKVLSGHWDYLISDKYRDEAMAILKRKMELRGKKSGKPTDTPEFKKWFGDSKVVDASGNPLVVYHGTDKTFDVFENKGGKVTVLFSTFDVERSGFFFAKDREMSMAYGSRVMPVFLSIQNPINMLDDKQFNKLVDELVDRGWNEKYLRRKDAWELFDTDDENNGKKLVEDLKSLGYDGAIIEEPSWKDENGEYGVSFVAFDSTQVKSVDNRGTFDPENPNIKMSWVPYRGVNKPRKGERVGWKNSVTGEIRYVDEKPGDEPSTAKKINWDKATLDNVLEVVSGHDELRELLEQDAGVSEGYSIGEHAGMVIDQWKLLAEQNKGLLGNLDKKIQIGLKEFMPLVLALHDIGKPLAIKKGGKHRQHEFTAPIVQKMLKEAGWSDRSVAIANALVSHDAFGKLLQGQISVEGAEEIIEEQLEGIDVDRGAFAELNRLFYMADAASYPYLRNLLFEDGDVLRLKNKKPMELVSLFKDEKSEAKESFDVAGELYHGTGYKFSEFDEEKVGGGRESGSLSYGWGIYFSTSEKMARQYAKAVCDEKLIDQLNARMSDIVDEIQAIPDGHGGTYSTEKGKALHEEYERLMDEKLSGPVAKGMLYKVKLNLKRDEIIDLDEGVASQPFWPKIRGDLEKYLIAAGYKSADEFAKYHTGRDLYDRLTDIAVVESGVKHSATVPEYQRMKLASKWLAKRGVKSLRHPVPVEDGAQNYVLLDADLAEIVSTETVKRMAWAPYYGTTTSTKGRQIGWRNTNTGEIRHQFELPTDEDLGIFAYRVGYPRKAKKMSAWVKYKGPRGGRGWKNSSTGEIRYVEDDPGRETTQPLFDKPASGGVEEWAAERFGDRVSPSGGRISDNFVKWFGDSKVVDKKGNPLVVYHGTNAAFSEFDPKKSGSKSKTGAPEGTHFFSSKPEIASSYTVKYQGDWIVALHDGANVMPCFLSLRNPMIVSARGENWDQILYRGEYYTINELAEVVKRQKKHDGLIVRRVTDKGIGDVESRLADTYIAFDSGQVKSSVGNNGEYSESKNIKMSWVKYKGPRDGRGWRNTSTSEIRYQEEKPGSDVRKRANFADWFGDSKAVDDQGKPLVLYHGTREVFDVFSKDRLGSLTGAESAKKAFFFSTDPDVSAGYPDGTRDVELRDWASVDGLMGAPTTLETRLPDAEAALARAEAMTFKVVPSGEEEGKFDVEFTAYDPWGAEYKYDSGFVFDDEVEADNYGFEYHAEKVAEAAASLDQMEMKRSDELMNGANIMPVYLSMQYPLEHDFEGDVYREVTFSDLIDAAKEGGHDGVIFRNVFDSPVGMIKSDVYAVFEPEQIKSAIGNRGTYSKTNPNIKMSWIKYSGPRGGKGWKNSVTGEIRYVDDKPGDDASPKAESPMASELALIPMFRGLRGDSTAAPSGPQYFSSSEAFAKTYGKVTKGMLRVKNPLVVSDDEWIHYASSFLNPVDAIVKKLKAGGYDSVVNVRKTLRGEKLYTALVVEAKDAVQDAVRPELGFEEWFAGSQVVDENGDPLMVYHGGRKNQTVFTGKEDQSNYIQGNIFFTNEPSVAAGYAHGNQRWKGGYVKSVELQESDGFYKTYLAIRNPLVVDANEESWMDIEFGGSTMSIDNLAVIARENGHDGLIVKNVVDQYGLADQYVAFSPTQIRFAADTDEDEKPLDGIPGPVAVPGRGKVQFGPNKTARKAAREYMKRAGLEYHPPTKYAKINKERATRIAAEFDRMKDDPDNPEVKAAYEAMARETLAQYELILETGLTIEPIDISNGDPYAASPRLAILDVQENNHLWYFPTDSGFGSDADFDASKNPLLAKTKYKDSSGRPMLVNDVFRVVHDYFGHIKEGNGFRAEGEENAWRSHSAMYSKLARRAMTSETRGQNSWVNFGPYGEANKTASAADTHYADQKVGLMPDWTMIEGAND